MKQELDDSRAKNLATYRECRNNATTSPRKRSRTTTFSLGCSSPLSFESAPRSIGELLGQ